MLHLSTAHLEELLILVFGAPGFLLFGWGLVARQFRGAGNGNFGFVDPTDSANRNPVQGVSRWKRRVIFTVIVAIFFLVSVCPVVLTLVMVYRGTNALKTEHATASSVVRNR